MLGISGLFAGMDLGVFSGRLFDLWDLTDSQFVKSLLDSFVKCEFFAVGFYNPCPFAVREGLFCSEKLDN